LRRRRRRRRREKESGRKDGDVEVEVEVGVKLVSALADFGAVVVVGGGNNIDGTTRIDGGTGLWTQWTRL